MDEGGGGGGRAGSPDWDPAALREEEFEEQAVYLVPDQPSEGQTVPRAQASLPRNLVLKPSQALSDVSLAFGRSCKRVCHVFSFIFFLLLVSFVE